MWTKLHWIEGPWPGRMALAARPRGGDWIEDELAHWRRQGVDVVCSLLMDDEKATLDLLDEGAAAQALGMRFIGFGIRDRDVPDSLPQFKTVLLGIESGLAQGLRVVIHCRQGVGRAGLTAACLLIKSGVPVDAAIARLSAARGVSVPETPEQRIFIGEYAGAF
jgi:protein-tyrosine phosphatase